MTVLRPRPGPSATGVQDVPSGEDVDFVSAWERRRSGKLRAPGGDGCANPEAPARPPGARDSNWISATAGLSAAPPGATPRRCGVPAFHVVSVTSSFAASA